MPGLSDSGANGKVSFSCFRKMSGAKDEGVIDDCCEDEAKAKGMVVDGGGGEEVVG